MAIPNTAALIKGGPNRDEAMELMAFLLSEKCEQMLAQSDSHNSPVHISLAEKFQRYVIKKPLDVDYEKVADNLHKAIETAREILH